MIKSFGVRLDENNGFGHGFDFVRIFLALSVLGWHCFQLAPGMKIESFALDSVQPLLWMWYDSILPMFFGLSGFLVAGSAKRLSLANFAINRGLRIFPALITEIILSALVLGPIFTELSLRQYFISPRLYSYFTSIVGLINYRLPGVFLTNPFPLTVNGSLWTVPFEMLCYLVTAFLIVKKYVQRGWLVIGIVALTIGAAILLQESTELITPKFHSRELIAYTFPIGLIISLSANYLHGATLLPCFLLGASFYALRYKIRFDARIFLGCLFFVFAIDAIGTEKWWNLAFMQIIIVPILIYIVCYVGLLKLPALPYFSTGDYSYGIYLYGFPIQQALVASYVGFRNPICLMIGSFVTVTMFATFSWHAVEKPILKLRKNFAFVGRQRERAMVNSQSDAGRDGVFNTLINRAGP